MKGNSNHNKKAPASTGAFGKVKPSMIKPSNICTKSITSAQLERASKFYDEQTKQNYYLVVSKSDELVDYRVDYDRARGFSCTCKAGQMGFTRCKAGYCEHVGIAVAAAREEKAQEKSEQDYILSDERLNDYRALAAVAFTQLTKDFALRQVARIEAARDALVKVAPVVEERAPAKKSYETAQYGTPAFSLFR